MIIASALFLFIVQAEDIEKSRIKLANCVAKVTIEHIGKKTPKPLFEDAARSSCAKEKAKYISSIKADEIKFGASEDEASEYASEEAENVVDSYINGYDDYLETNTIPALE
ncbi:hypothetical protein ACR9YC_06970 [Parasphingorhabdus sp. DH2-15]|uniref:hypothetical protein n=1 Tax=Parasphingorhabdus sp. DH2-15 TaxID=3444112 RepID=UPI003F687869